MKLYCGLVGCLLLLSYTAAAGQNLGPSSVSSTDHNLSISSAAAWTDTQIDLRAGDVVRITSTAGKGNCNPEGVKKTQESGLPLSNVAPGTLIGKLGTEAPFPIGASKDLTVSQPGHLYLGMNAAAPACDGELVVKVQVTAAAGQAADIKSKLASAARTWLSGQFGSGSSPAAASPVVAAPAAPAIASAAVATTAPPTTSDTSLDPQLGKDLESLPRRVNDEFKNLGDMVNFVIVGSQDQLQTALASAGWRIADQSKATAIANAVIATYQKQDYVQMPMSTLYLFDRPQDFGYEQAEAYSVVASRHHFRIWKAPFAWNGQPVWIGAGTHDIGFEKDQRNGTITHKIDPAVDGERDHIGGTLQNAGMVKNMSYYLPSNPVKDARNATGGSYQSDGRVLIIFLR